MLRVSDINVFYGVFHVLQGVSLEINEGEIVALLGENGAGKTITINTISGILEPKAGNIEFDGILLNEIPAYKRAEMGVIQVPEGRKLFPSMSVMDNLLVGSFLKQTHKNRRQNLELCFDLFPKLYERKDQ